MRGLKLFRTVGAHEKNDEKQSMHALVGPHISVFGIFEYFVELSCKLIMNDFQLILTG